MTAPTTTPQDTFEAARLRSEELEKKVLDHPDQFRVLTGDRPTGRLHVGHLFGTLQNRVRLQRLGVASFIVIADYQVLTDREACEGIAKNVRELTLDYLAAGLDPHCAHTFIFPHSHVPELNQLLVVFLTLVTNAELDRNPTVKEEIQATGAKQINAGMYTYPVHQAADILFCKANLVPVGKDQLPHLEMTRTIARRFNARYGPVFPEPQALLSAAPQIKGLDGSLKMSKSRNNAIALSASEDETAALIRSATTDGNRIITYEPETRPEVANLLLLASLASGEAPESIAARIGDGGAGMLKRILTEALNEHLRPMRQRRKLLEQNPDHIRNVLMSGIGHAREMAEKTLCEVRKIMDMEL
ncbi:tryptophan--tRNA ligase [Geothrix terrae]|uniref:tryptophan--tRNA ligase n=1 Tax=Geothrix terrae TaxID=2922720 RepID=UPI001FACB0F7|nr:tryptophan--tRNA ligase [Geothrix terrae]